LLEYEQHPAEMHSRSLLDLAIGLLGRIKQYFGFIVLVYCLLELTNTATQRSPDAREPAGTEEHDNDHKNDQQLWYA